MGKFSIYNRNKALQYAHKWAYERNPSYYDFSKVGGDCTNFASQVLYAGTGIMNYTPVTGWFYIDGNKRTASWTGVPFFYNFVTANHGAGPFGEEVELRNVEPGDFIQLALKGEDFTHTLAVVSTGPVPGINNVLIAAHSYDADDRPLRSYSIEKLRCIHILGYR